MYIPLCGAQWLARIRIKTDFPLPLWPIRAFLA